MDIYGMTSRNLPAWQYRTGRSPRATEVRKLLNTFLIVCEGSKTEVAYFEMFGSRADVRVHGGMGQWEECVRAAIKIRDEDPDAFDQVWCVFDRDIVYNAARPKDKFQSALDIAKANGIKVAYSIDSFELWYVLHYNYHTTQTNRHEYCEMLTRLTGKEYDKADPTLFHTLKERLPDAIKNAKKLHVGEFDGRHHFDNDPSTTVYLLVTELIKNQIK